MLAAILDLEAILDFKQHLQSLNNIYRGSIELLGIEKSIQWLDKLDTLLPRHCA